LLLLLDFVEFGLTSHQLLLFVAMLLDCAINGGVDFLMKLSNVSIDPITRRNDVECRVLRLLDTADDGTHLILRSEKLVGKCLDLVRSLAKFSFEQLEGVIFLLAHLGEFGLCSDQHVLDLAFLFND
jgi:hypothetical protein